MTTISRGVLVTPFHDRLLLCPDSGPADVERTGARLEGFLAELRS